MNPPAPARKVYFTERLHTRLCRRCSYAGGGCPYWNQFRDHRFENWILPHAHLTLGTIDRQDPRPTLVVIDEDIIGTALGHKSYLTAADLARTAAWVQRNALPSWRSPLLDLLDALGGVLTQRGTVRNFQIASEVGQEALLAATLTWGQAGSQLLFQERHFLKDAAFDALYPPTLGRLMKVITTLAARSNRACIRKYDDPGRGAVLVLYDLVRPQLGNLPAIVLDSTGSPAIYERIFQGRRVDTFDFDVACEARVVQVADGTYGKTVTEGDERTRKRLLDSVRHIVRHRGSHDHPVALITHMGLETAVRNMDLRHLRTGHFYAERGTNRFTGNDSRDMVVVGTPTPNLDDLEMGAEALYAADTEDLDFRSEYMPRPYGMRDDDDMDSQTEIRDYIDPRLRELVGLFREAEINQAALRGRPLENGDQKTIWLLTSLPVPGLPPTDLVMLDDILVVARGPTTLAAVMTLRERVVDARQQLKKDLGRQPYNDEVAATVGCSKSAVSKYLNPSKQGRIGKASSAGRKRAAEFPTSPAQVPGDSGNRAAELPAPVLELRPVGRPHRCN